MLPNQPNSRLVVLAVLLAVVTGLVIAPVGGVAAQEDMACEYPIEVEDATGTTITIDEPPEDIVVLHAGSAQIVHDLDAWDRVSGAPVTPFTAYLENHDAPTDVTDDEGFPIQEEIVDLEPDLVLVGHLGDPANVEMLRDQGLTVYMGPTPTSVDDIQNKVLRYGELIGACQEASDEVAWMDERLEAVDELTEDIEEPLVYYELGDGWTFGEGTFQADMIERAGAENLGTSAGLDGWGTVSTETVVDMDPDWILYGDSFEEPPISEPIEETTAVHSDNVLAVNANYMSQSGPRVVLAIEEMAEAFAESAETDDDAVSEEADDEEPTDTTADDTADDTEDQEITADDDGLPGFGIVAALAAVVLTMLLRRSP